MQLSRVDQLRHSRMRLVYSDTVVSFSLASNVMYGELARTLAAIFARDDVSPLAIDVTVDRPENSLTDAV
jgi:hypothetical protein